MESLKKKARTVVEKLWWLDILTPFFISFFIFLSLVYFIFAGEPHRTVASKIQLELLSQSLSLAGPRPTPSFEKFITITFTEDDKLKLVTRFGADPYPAALLDLIKRIEKTEIEHAYIVLVPNDVPASVYSSPVPANFASKFSVASQNIYDHSNSIFRYLPFLHAWPCLGKQNLVCVYDETWEQDLLQDIILKTKANDSIKRFFSTNLPSQNQSFILHFNEAKDFRDISFSDVILGTIDPEIFKEKIIFIGTNIERNTFPMFNVLEIGKVLTPLDPADIDPRLYGTSFHTFLAQFGQMMIDNSFIGVAPFWVTLTIGVIFCLILFFLFLKAGSVWALGFFFFFLIIAPTINAQCVNWFHFYFPIFEPLFFGASFLMFSGLAKLGSLVLRQRQMSIQENINQDLADLKANFLSLISHNLITPLAKAKGMLEHLKYQASPAICPHVEMSLYHTTQIQFAIKTVLLLSQLEDDAFQLEKISAKSLQIDFETEQLTSLHQLYRKASFQLDCDESELIELPLQLDKRVISHFILAGLILLTEDRSDHPATVLCKVDDPLQIELSLTFDFQITPKTKALITTVNDQYIPPDHAIDFLDSLLQQYWSKTIKAFQGHIDILEGQIPSRRHIKVVFPVGG